MSCEFSDLVACSAVCLAPNNHYLAMLSGIKISIREVNSLKIVHVYACVDKVDKFEFSPDSEYILCALYARTCVQVFSLADPEWKCRINEGVAGLVAASWCPNSRALITESDFGIQMTIWSLTDETSYILTNPKQNIYRAERPGLTAPSSCQQQLYSFSECGRFLAVVHRVDLHDQIAVYATDSWTEINRFPCRSSDVICVQWSPGGAHIVTTDSPLTYNIHVYRPSGELQASFQAYEHALGVRQIVWPASTAALPVAGVAPLSLAAVGSYDGRVRLLSLRTWQLAFVLPLVHPHNLEPSLTTQSALLQSQSAAQIELITLGVGEDSRNQGSLIWIESIIDAEGDGTDSLPKPPGQSQAVNKLGGSFSALAAHLERSSKTVLRAPSTFARRNIKQLPRVLPDPRSSKATQPLMGVHWQQFCPATGRYLACREESQLRCMWIWSMTDIKLSAVLLMQDAILSSAWRPSLPSTSSSSVPMLAFCTGTSRVYFWSPRETSPLFWSDVPLPPPVSVPGQVLPVPSAAMIISSLQWSPDGQILILQSRESFVTCEVNWQMSGEGIAGATLLMTESISAVDAI